MRTLEWVDGVIDLIDQTRLPEEEVRLRIGTVEELVAAVKRLSIRGAPAIGVAGAYGVALAARANDPSIDPAGFERAVGLLRSARPTAVNLSRMVDRVAAVARATAAAGADAGAEAVAEAGRVGDEELAASLAMGEAGADLVLHLVGRPGIRAMTICNTGGLATVERGTALAVIQTLHERGALIEAVAMETRPLLQGARLTTWELARMGAPHRLAADGAGPFLLARGAADVVLIGADRVAANGDTANKIGSYSLALGAARAGVPFVVVAPESTVDLDTPDGSRIDIEDRGAEEIVTLRGVSIAPPGTGALNPAFDVTPVDLITALVTDQRVVRFDRGETLETTPFGLAGPARPGAQGPATRSEDAR
jgi:methylthioribose-1-phosphate isomerase